jgi:tRNA-2-methylthio-N6-dimethylallyladenosine synthase
MPKVYLETFGCQMNKLDSELVAGELLRRGCELVPAQDDADVILFNTCSVREHAEQKVYSRLGQLKRRKERFPGLVLGVIGCMAENVREELFARVPHLDLICGPGELHRVPELIDQAAARRTHAVALAPARRGGRPPTSDDDPLEQLDLGRAAAVRDDPFRAYVRVQRGCNHMCAFCIVPYTRGKEVYRPAENIVREVEGLVDDGVLEVTLLGQNINSYSGELDGRPVGLGGVIRRLDQVPGLRRIRFVTSHPADMDDDILRAVGECEKACPYLHMPPQSGSNAVLARMRRTYTREFYLERVDAARRFIPEVQIAADFIVGFPGETDADFEQSVELVRRVGFKNSFIFKYSPRPGTPAAGLADDVPDAVKRRRNHRLLEVQQEVSQEVNRALAGRTVQVLVEGPSRRAESSPEPTVCAEAAVEGRALIPASQVRLLAGAAASAAGGAHRGDPADRTVQLTGRTSTDHIVVFDGPVSLRGGLVPVRIDRAGATTLFGTLL